MARQRIWQEIELKLREIKKESRSFPDHPVAQAGMVANESGKLLEASIMEKYNLPTNAEQKNDQPASKEAIPDKVKTAAIKRESIRTAAIRTAAMAIRLLENLK